MKHHRWLACLMLAMLSVPAMGADGTSLSTIAEAAKRSGDKSRQALVSIFGDVVNNPLAASGGDGDTILANLFQTTNGGLLVIGGLFACYVWWRKLTQVAHDGSIFGKAQHAMWGPVRIVWGIASLVPTANGWALSQLLMLWAASLLGVGIANIGTDGAVSAFSDGKGMIVQPAMPDTIVLAQSLFEANLCMHSMNAGQAMSAANGGFDFANEYVQQFGLPNGFILQSPNKAKVCGGASLDEKLLAPTPQGTQWFGTSIDTAPIYQAHLRALTAMQQALSKDALDFVNAATSQMNGAAATLPDANLAIERAALQYETSVNQEAGKKAGDIGALATKLGEDIKSGGWWTLGAWYQTFAHANSKLSSAVAGKAQTYGESFAGDQGISAVRDTILKSYKTQQAASTNSVALGQMVSTTSTDTSTFLRSLFDNPGQKLVSYMTNADLKSGGGGTTNPLIKMKNLGDYTLATAETAVGIYAAAKAVVSGITGKSLTALITGFATGAPDFIKGILEAISPFFLMIV